MNKNDFVSSLRKALYGLPKDEIEERLTFYCEIIDDRIEEGCSEEEAVSAVGNVGEIAEMILSEIPLSKIAKERVSDKRRLKVWKVVFLILGAPIWLSLCIASIAVVLSVYILVWSLIVLCWAVFGLIIGCSVGGITAGVILIFSNNLLAGIALIGAGFVCAGLSVFAFYFCRLISKVVLKLTKRFAVRIKRIIIEKEVE